MPTPYHRFMKVIPRKSFLVSCAGACMVCTLLSAAAPVVEDTRAPDCPVVVVRAYFDRVEMISQVYRWSDPWEVNRTDGFLIVEADEIGLSRLKDAGFTVVVDEDLTRAICNPRTRLEGQKAGIVGLPCYRTVDETFADVERLVGDYPNLAQWIDIGDSWEVHSGWEPGYEGDDIMVLKLGNSQTPGVGTPAAPDSKPILFVQGGIHARECPGPELLTRFAEDLLAGYGSDADATWLLDEHEIHLLLFLNPDGRRRAEEGAYWRKNANNNHCTGTEVRGVDLNRNFDFRWNCCGLSSANDCDLTYHGIGGGSEPETRAVQDYLRSVFPSQWTPDPPRNATGVYIDLHSYGREVYWPWLHTSLIPPNWTSLATLGRKLAYFNGYDPLHTPSVLDGSAMDFAYGELGVASYLFELGTAFFQNCDHFESRLLPDHLDALRYAAKIARTPYITPAGPDVTEIEILGNPVVVAGKPLQLEARADDGRYQNSQGREPVQNVVAVRVYLDTPPWHPEPGRSWLMFPVDGAYDSSTEEVERTIDTTGLEPGRHILFFRAKDDDGVWGAVSAEFISITDPTRRPQGRVAP